MPSTPFTVGRVVGPALVAAATVLSLAACGSSSGGGPAGGSGTDSTAGSTGSSAAGGQTATSSSPTGGAGSSAAAPTLSASGSGSFCGFARDERKDEAADEAAYASYTPAKLKALEQTTAVLLVKFESLAPSQIRSAVHVVVDGDDQLIHSLAAVGYDVKKVSPTSLSRLNTPAFDHATKQVAAYLSGVCHIAPAVSGSS